LVVETGVPGENYVPAICHRQTLSCIIAYQNKNQTFNWLNTLHVTFTISWYRLECWYRPVQKPCRLVLLVYTRIFVCLHFNKLQCYL
jgi:hypothetical protein